LPAVAGAPPDISVDQAGAATDDHTGADDERTGARRPLRFVRTRRFLQARRADLLLAGAAFVGAGAPRALTAGAYSGPDEFLWMLRSRRFLDAVIQGEPSVASATNGEPATMPGVTTMWVGSAARTVWLWGVELGVIGDADIEAGFANSRSGLFLAQLMMGLVTAALVAVVVVLVARWAGRGAALVAGVLLATEPLLVAHGATLHTDELVGLFGVAGLLATALALGVPQRTGVTDRPAVAVAAGALCCLAVLTKLSALAFLPAAVVLGAWAAVVRWRAGAGAPADGRTGADGADGRARAGAGVVRSLARLGGLWLVGAVAVLALYPALWSSPVTEVGRLLESATLATEDQPQFFFGEVTGSVGPHFYLVVLPFRLTPWFFLALLASALLVWARPAARGHATALVVMGLPTFAAISLSSKQIDRYAVPLVVLGAVAIGVGAVHLHRWVHERTGLDARHPRVVGGLGLGAFVLVGYALVVAPWSSTYYNPLLGGGDRAVQSVLVGRGEGVYEVGDLIAEREAGRCDEITVRALISVGAFPCGAWVWNDDADYLVVSAGERQLSHPERFAERLGDRPLVAVVSVRGVVHTELWGPPGQVVETTVITRG
jgi:hypothetical protein